MEDPVIRLPKYGRGLQLVRGGVVLMLAQLGLSLVVISKLIAGSADTLDWMKYTMWANIAAAAVMLLGTLFAVPDFVRTKIPLRPIVVAAIAFGITIITLVYPYLVLTHLMDLLEQIKHDRYGGALDELVSATDSFVQLDWIAVVKDIAYTVGLLSIVSSIRETAQVNEHFALRDTAAYVGRLLGVMLAADVIYQLAHRAMGSVLSVITIIVLIAALGILVYWIYCHFKLQKFLKAAAILVNEPHHLPIARVVSPSESAPATALAPGPKPRISAPRVATGPVSPVPAAMPTTPSQPVIVAAEIRSAPAPRAETAPGEAAVEPKFLR